MIGFTQEDYSTLETIKQTGGIAPDKHWETNRQKILQAVDLTALLGLEYLTFHFGFIDNSEQKIRERVRFLADAAERVDEIDEERAKSAMDRAQSRMETVDTDVNLERALSSLRRATIRLNASARFKRKRSSGLTEQV